VDSADHDALGTLPLHFPDQWMDLPDGSMVIVDECQHWWPPRSSGSKAPPHTLALQEHRHRGFDFIFVTQHPNLIDHAVRDLVEKHEHVVRPFQRPYQKVFTYQGINKNPAPTTDPVEEKRKFDPDLYRYYKSASLHTKTNKFPLKVIYRLVGAISVVVFGCYFSYSTLMGFAKADPKGEVGAQNPPPVETAQASQGIELPEYYFSGSWVSGDRRILWVSSEQGDTLDISELGGYRVTESREAVLLDQMGKAFAIVRDPQFVSMLW